MVAIAFATASALEGSALAAAGGLSKHFLRSHGGIVAEYDLTNQEGLDEPLAAAEANPADAVLQGEPQQQQEHGWGWISGGCLVLPIV